VLDGPVYVAGPLRPGAVARCVSHVQGEVDSTTVDWVVDDDDVVHHGPTWRLPPDAAGGLIGCVVTSRNRGGVTTGSSDLRRVLTHGPAGARPVLAPIAVYCSSMAGHSACFAQVAPADVFGQVRVTFVIDARAADGTHTTVIRDGSSVSLPKINAGTFTILATAVGPGGVRSRPQRVVYTFG
jgi:hypothetical protein